MRQLLVTPEQYDSNRILRSCLHDPAAFPLIRAVLCGHQRGTLLTSSQDNSTSAIAITQFGFMQQLGHSTDSVFNKEFEQVLQNAHSGLPRYLLWYAPSSRWQRWLEKNATQVNRRNRIRWKFGGLPLARIGRSLSPSLRILPITAEWLEQSTPLGMNIGSRFWHCTEDFLHHGFGVCIVDQANQVIAAAYTACIVDGIAEVDIGVLPDWRHQGLGYFLGRALIEQCLTHGVQPSWDCFETNLGSMNLADSLGFNPSQTYPLYSFETPLTSNQQEKIIIPEQQLNIPETRGVSPWQTSP
jgi:GNAT superfamily N-acetyltransferase